MNKEDVETRANQLKEKMNKITKNFSDKSETIDDMEVEGNELEDLVTDVIDDSDKQLEEFGDSGRLITPTEALNLSTLIDDFKYVRNTLKTNADAGRRIIANVTLSILDFDTDSELSDKALLISAFADVNKCVAINMDLYLKTYKEISTILLQLNKIKDTQDDLNGGDKKPKKEKEINTSDLIKELNTIT